MAQNSHITAHNGVPPMPPISNDLALFDDESKSPDDIDEAYVHHTDDVLNGVNLRYDENASEIERYDTFYLVSSLRSNVVKIGITLLTYEELQTKYKKVYGSLDEFLYLKINNDMTRERLEKAVYQFFSETRMYIGKEFFHPTDKRGRDMVPVYSNLLKLLASSDVQNIRRFYMIHGTTAHAAQAWIESQHEQMAAATTAGRYSSIGGASADLNVAIGLPMAPPGPAGRSGTTFARGSQPLVNLNNDDDDRILSESKVQAVSAAVQRQEQLRRRRIQEVTVVAEDFSDSESDNSTSADSDVDRDEAPLRREASAGSSTGGGGVGRSLGTNMPPPATPPPPAATGAALNERLRQLQEQQQQRNHQYQHANAQLVDDDGLTPGSSGLHSTQKGGPYGGSGTKRNGKRHLLHIKNVYMVYSERAGVVKIGAVTANTPEKWSSYESCLKTYTTIYGHVDAFSFVAVENEILGARRSRMEKLIFRFFESVRHANPPPSAPAPVAAEAVPTVFGGATRAAVVLAPPTPTLAAFFEPKDSKGRSMLPVYKAVIKIVCGALPDVNADESALSSNPPLHVLQFHRIYNKSSESRLAWIEAQLDPQGAPLPPVTAPVRSVSEPYQEPLQETSEGGWTTTSMAVLEQAQHHLNQDPSFHNRDAAAGALPPGPPGREQDAVTEFEDLEYDQDHPTDKRYIELSKVARRST